VTKEHGGQEKAKKSDKSIVRGFLMNAENGNLEPAF